MKPGNDNIPNIKQRQVEGLQLPTEDRAESW